MPVKIDGTDITGATIDGTEVQEITVDGQTVFSAGPSNLPVAYSNLVAWYPFDSATYGGSDADDVTAIIGGSGDDTAYNGTLINSPTHQTSGGVTDINAGANSGGFDFGGDSSGDRIELPFTNALFNNGPQTITAWFNQDTQNDDEYRGLVSDRKFNGGLMIRRSGAGTNGIFYGYMSSQSNEHILARGENFQEDANRWRFAAGSTDGTLSDIDIYYDDGSGNVVSQTTSKQTLFFESKPFFIGGSERSTDQILNGQMDDVRFYNTRLSQSQLQQIYDNTNPN